MTTLLLTLLMMVLIMLAMAIGVILKKKPIKGSCGGLNAIGLEAECEICGNRSRCKKRSTKKPATD